MGFILLGLSASSSSSSPVHACPSSPLSLFFLLSLQLSVMGPLRNEREGETLPSQILSIFAFLGVQELFHPFNYWYLHPSSNSAAVFSFSGPSTVSLVELHLPRPVFLSGWSVPLQLLLIVTPMCLLGFLGGFQEIWVKILLAQSKIFTQLS